MGLFSKEDPKVTEAKKQLAEAIAKDKVEKAKKDEAYAKKNAEKIENRKKAEDNFWEGANKSFNWVFDNPFRSLVFTLAVLGISYSRGCFSESMAPSSTPEMGPVPAYMHSEKSDNNECYILELNPHTQPYILKGKLRTDGGYENANTPSAFWSLSQDKQLDVVKSIFERADRKGNYVYANQILQDSLASFIKNGKRNAPEGSLYLIEVARKNPSVKEYLETKLNVKFNFDSKVKDIGTNRRTSENLKANPNPNFTINKKPSSPFLAPNFQRG